MNIYKQIKLKYLHVISHIRSNLLPIIQLRHNIINGCYRGCILTLLFVFYSTALNAQKNVLDSLVEKLNAEYDSNQLALLIDQTKIISEINPAQAEIYIYKSLGLSEKYAYIPGIAKCNNLLGNVYLKTYEYVKAKNAFEKSIEYYLKTGSKAEIANTRNNLGTVYQNLGEYAMAIESFLSAYGVYEDLNDKKGLAIVCNNLGVLYYMLDQTDKSISFYKQASDLLEGLNDIVNLKNAAANLGAAYHSQWQNDSALFYFNKCFIIERDISDTSGMGKTLCSIGSINVEKQNLKLGEDQLNQALVYSNIAKDYDNICSAYESLGLLCIKKNNLEKAEYYFDSCYIVASENNIIDQIKIVHLRRAELCEKNGEFKKAYQNYRLYEEYKSTLLIEQNLVTEREAIFLKQKQENRILRLEKEQEKRKTQIIILIAALIIIVLISIFIISFYKVSQKRILEREITERQKKQYNAVLEAQERERKRIAGDLHDSVGQILSVTKLNISELVDFIKDKESEEGELLDRSLKMLDEACQEVRDISHNLMPGSLIRLGLISALKDLIRKINLNNKVNILLKPEDNNARFNEKIELALYRILQETLNNAIKHSQASEIIIELKKLANNKLFVKISDNGVGFDVSTINLSSGIGWKNIYSRLSIINGKMDVYSEKDKGTQISIKIPM